MSTSGAGAQNSGPVGTRIGSVAAAFAPGMGRSAQAQAVGGIIFGLAVVGLAMAIVGPGSWTVTGGTVPLAIWERILAVMVALVLVTSLSYVPLMIYRTFTQRELEQLKDDWEQELASHSWDNLAKRIKDVVDSKYSLERYNYPLLSLLHKPPLGYNLCLNETRLGEGAHGLQLHEWRPGAGLPASTKRV